VDFDEDGPWLDHLRRHVPPELAAAVQFRPLGEVPVVDGRFVYTPGCGAIQIRTLRRDEHGPTYLVSIRHPGKDDAGMAPFEVWFWKETHNHFHARAQAALQHAGTEAVNAAQLPTIYEEKTPLAGSLDARSAIATALVLFTLFFVCVYLLSSLTC